MSGQPLQRETTKTVAIQQRKKKRKYNRLGLIGAMLLWAGLLIGGYYAADLYIAKTQQTIEEKFAEISTQNKQQVTQLEEQINKTYEELIQLKSELAYIQENLTIAGETISGSDETKVALSERMQQLDDQLRQLQKSIERLEDAAR